MMRVYLMQHGKPVSKEENPERPLSAEGERDVERMGDFLKKRGIKPEEVFHSGKTRARETAEIMIARLNPALKAEERGGLSPLDDVNEIADHIKSSLRDLMIAGHLPHLAKLISLLVTGDESEPIVRFQQGGVVCLQKDEGGKWAVAWMFVPEIIQGAR